MLTINTNRPYLQIYPMIISLLCVNTLLVFVLDIGCMYAHSIIQGVLFLYKYLGTHLSNAKADN